MVRVLIVLTLALATAVSARNRILDGTPIDISEAPFAAAITRTNNWGTHSQHCGGIVLTSRHILTVAAQFEDPLPVHFVRLGSTYWNSGGVYAYMVNVVRHPDYNPHTAENDISVGILFQPVLIGPGTGIANAVLPHPSTVLPTDAELTVVGWGSYGTGIPSPHLRGIEVLVIDEEVCAERLANAHLQPVFDSMFCAGVLDVTGYDTCTGDDGGPAFADGVVHGLASWGVGCGQAQFPSAYVRVARFTPWVESTVNSTQSLLQRFDY